MKSTDQIGGNLNLRVERISQPDVNISLVTLDAKGNEKQHQLQLNVQGEPVSGQLALTGSFDRTAAALERDAEQHPFRYAGRANGA